jgi:hypothetical protein
LEKEKTQQLLMQVRDKLETKYGLIFLLRNTERLSAMKPAE